MPWAPEMPRPRGAIPEVPHGPQRQGPGGFCNMNQSSEKLCFPAHDRAYLEDIPKDRLGGIGFAEMSHVTCFEGFHLVAYVSFTFCDVPCSLVLHWAANYVTSPDCAKSWTLQ